jgi:hypothetical protein
MKNNTMVSFELIKGRISRYTQVSQLSGCIHILDEIQKSKEPYPFWNVLILLKWIILYSKNSRLLQNATIQDVSQTLRLIEKFDEENNHISFKKKNEIVKGIKIIAYQQFWYQDFIANIIFERQFIIYELLKHKFDINKEFHLISGLTIREFLNICYSVFLYLNADKFGNGFSYDGFIHQDYFDLFTKKFGEHKLTIFFKLLTIKNQSDIANLHKSNNESYQLFETNFLLTKPFFKTDNGLKLPHRAIFNQTCKHFVFDYLKNKSEKFSEEFGRRLEKYVELGLQEAKFLYKNETEIKNNYSVKKVADFFLEREHLFLECKAIEISPLAAIQRKSKLLYNSLKDSVIKAYCQMLDVANIIDNNFIYYGFVITYKETYLGYGSDVWDEFLKDYIENFAIENDIPISILPPENLFFIDIETWDYIVQSVVTNKCSLIDIIEKAKENRLNPNPTTCRILLDQVLREHFKIDKYNLSYLQQAHRFIELTQ